MDLEKDGFIISTDKSKLNIPYIHGFLSQTYWAENIPMETVQRSIEGSVCFGVYEGDQQVGFARVITDKATFGYLADVFVDEAYRGKGLANWLMEVILSEPELQGFRSWQLATRDAHALYAKFGFTPLDDPSRIMRKYVADIYKAKNH